MRRLAAALALSLLAACHVRTQAPQALPALEEEGEARVYLEPYPDDAARLAFTLAGVSAIRSDGSEAPLEVALSEISGATASAERLVATGRLPPGSYGGLALRVRRATLAHDGEVADLLVGDDPVRVDVPFAVEQGRAVVLRLSLRRGQALGFAFAGAFAGVALAPESSTIQLAGYCATPALAGVVVFDRRAHAVTGVLPTGRQPLGVALDVRALRAYVALAGEDRVQVLDLVSGEELRRIPLRTGDEPRELALTADGASLLTTNAGSDSVSFIDTSSAAVVETVSVGEDPSALLIGGRRAYVLSRRAHTLTVLDLATRAVVSTVRTEPEPLRAQLSRDGTRLYLVARGSAYLTVFSVPEMTEVRRVFVGLGAGALKVDPRTDLVYVGRADEGRIQVFDPMSALPVDSIQVPGPVSYLALDDVENALVAVIPSLRQVAFVDVTRKRLAGTVDVGGAPYQVTLLGERH